jgi:hypothetical protein
MRRDRLLLVSAFAMALLTMLGAVGESLGMDRLLKSNTSKTRTHSLFRQGCMLYELIPNMPEHRLAPLIAAFAKAVSQLTTPLISDNPESLVEDRLFGEGSCELLDERLEPCLWHIWDQFVEPWRNSEWVRVLLVFDFRWRS